MNTAPSMAVLAEAADWLVCLQSGEASAQARADFERWRTASPQHAAAWQRAEAVLGDFASLPAETTRRTLSRLDAPRRRQALRVLGLMLAAAPAGWLAWRQAPLWTADLRTATGERSTLDLADGTRLVLDTASAVKLRLAGATRQVHLLAGSILVSTGRQSLDVTTQHGAMRAIDSRFAVRLLDAASRLSVFNGAVAITPAHAGGTYTAQAGEEVEFTQHDIAPPRPLGASLALWDKGMLVAKDMRLDTLLAELGRYRHGIVRCDPAVASLRVSGAFPVHDFARSLVLLRQTLPVQMSSVGPYWITIERAL
ncbi:MULTISPECIES: FecR domain-containing protein [unclassified Janthinobacterium]|uniref:FecR domain-containing protein n=1 Tax=unclassified Janthinobacterium TaxID=2610881 RepID=UPI00161F474A|nr:MULTISPECIES: FecR domain-containing protein [unclassified Janthinobacterium]MBB5609325.1 transmembrane sensor [Janthinobacterium sp. S3T4]MBB5614498.1 transmembrane sensor [Janthinobacterium sp. S3M3]